ncbi:MAG: hypothetical protein KY444_10460 [Gemmatimonadetes bacterium]|nr:hypothetical protein [Gemmatimonadota bacterium]
MKTMIAQAKHPALRQAEELTGLLFSTPKDLRHRAEEVLGQLFVPVEVLNAGEESADIVLRPSGFGEIHVHAERERHWYPYQITRVDTVVR